MTDYYLLALFTVCFIVRCMSTLMCIYFLSSVLLVDLTLYILLHRITGWSYIMHLLPAGYTVLVLLLLSHILLAQLYSQVNVYMCIKLTTLYHRYNIIITCCCTKISKGHLVMVVESICVMHRLTDFRVIIRMNNKEIINLEHKQFV